MSAIINLKLKDRWRTILITKCEINNFKGFEHKIIELENFSLLVGQNNIGKSTILHAILLAHEIIKKSITIKTNKTDVKYELKSTTLTLEELKIIPLSIVDSIWKDNKFTQTNESKIKLYFIDDDYIECSLRRGKNSNVAVAFSYNDNISNSLLIKLVDSLNPYALLVPGLAGIPSKEGYVGKYARTRSITVGDSNLVLRNIVASLGLNKNKRSSFEKLIDRIKFVFPDIFDIRVKYNEDTDEYLTVEYSKHGKEDIYFDIVTAGTGFLQTLQILSYIFEYTPQILLLDEPDSHLHADNQVKLLKTLLELSEEYNFQIIVSTHSREFLQNTPSSSIVWLNSEEVVRPGIDVGNMVQAYIDLGGLDKLDKLRLNPKSVNLLSEDGDLSLWRSILRKRYGEDYETRVIINTFKGKSNKVALFLVSQFYKQHFPNCKVGFIIDRDFDSEESLQVYIDEARNQQIKPFILNHHEIENILINPRVLKIILELQNMLLDEDEIKSLIERAIIQSKTMQFNKLIDKIGIENRKYTPSKCNEVATQVIEEKASGDFEEYISWLRGKPIFKNLKELIKNEYKLNLTVDSMSEALLRAKISDIENIFEWIER